MGRPFECSGTSFSVNQTFHKGWLLHNCGTNAWVNYKAIRVGGDLAGPDSIAIPPTSGHQDVAVWGDFTAPALGTSSINATYQLVNAQNDPVPNASFNVEI